MSKLFLDISKNFPKQYRGASKHAIALSLRPACRLVKAIAIMPFFTVRIW
jgi:hypothetical protein